VVVGDLRNLTGDARLDDALEQAFRISLEQSRYVNVVSDLKVRETLQRMQRPDGTKVDRDIGSEIAQRDGARALVLPTVAEVGGHLRVSLEVVDPRTQTTVYALSQDGKGIGSALASVDKVNEHLREQLGEALQSVQKSALPLPDAGTPNLEALKAYALARNLTYTTRDRDSTVSLYRRALALDPQFALAHADLARFLASIGEPGNALDEWRKALAIPNRLTQHETLRVQLMLQQGTTPAAYFHAAKQYLALYPDDDQVIGRLATNTWHQLNEFALAEKLFRWSLEPAFPSKGLRTYGLAITQLGQERIPQALDTFRKSNEYGFSGAGEYYARAFDALGRHADADKVFFASAGGRAGWKGETAVTTWIDRGQWVTADADAKAWVQGSEKAGDVLGMLRARAALATVATLTGQGKDAPRRLDELLDSVRTNARAVDAIYPPASAELRLYAGLLAARRGDARGVDAALAATRDSQQVRDFPTLVQLRQVVLAEQERLSGNPRAAMARLAPLAAQDSALVCVHWALRRAALAAGDGAVAASQEHWFSSHRGRRFAESTTTDVLRFFNAAPLDATAH